MEKRLPRGTLTPLVKRTGFAPQYLSALIKTKRRPSPKRALYLEAAAREVGKDMPATMWVFGSRDDLQRAVTEYAG